MSQKILLLIGTESGLFVAQSDSLRRKWVLRGPYLQPYSIFCCAADRRENPSVFYTGGSSMHFGPAIFFSRDYGKKWNETKQTPRFAKSSGLSVEGIWQIVPEEKTGRLYAGVAPAALFHSADGGETWHEMTGLSRHETRSAWKPCKGGLCLHSILVDPRDERHLVAGISAVGVFESFDKGKTWKLANEGLPSHAHPAQKSGPTSCVHRIVWGAGGLGILYQQNHSGVWMRAPGESKWIPIGRTLPSSAGFALVPHPFESNSVFVIPNTAPMRPKRGLPTANSRGVRISSRTLAGPELSVYLTRNRGKSWRKLHRGLPDRAHVKVLRDAFGSDFLKPVGLYFGTTSGHLFTSTDGGESWKIMASFLPKIQSVHPVVL